MEKCFVIQPFDGGIFDKRYADVFEPAIVKAGFHAYRIDQDPTVRIPIAEIERGISQSDLCFAEITTDNPNVWYELGFAFACRKEVVLICSDERIGKFPFDIQHRYVIRYKTNSTSDFNALESAITERIKAFQKTAKTVKSLNDASVIETEGLKPYEIALLMLLLSNQFSEDEYTSVYVLKDEMDKIGYTALATSVSIRSLKKKEMIETFKMQSESFNAEEYLVVRLLEKGEKWLLENQDKLKYTKNESEDKDVGSIIEENLPF